MRRILVTAAGDPAGRSLLAMLSARGIAAVPAAVNLQTAPPGTIAVPAASDPAFPTVLVGLARAVRAELIIPAADDELDVLARSLRVSRPEIPVLMGPANAVITAGDRWLTHRALRAAGVAVPRTLLGADAGRRAIRDGIGVPFVTRPRAARTARAARLHRRPPAPLRPIRWDDIVQEFAPGTGYAAYVAMHDDPALDRVVVRGTIGGVIGARRVEAPDVAGLALTAARVLGLRGPVTVAVRRAVGGAPLVLGVDARFGAEVRHADEVLDAVLTARSPMEPGTAPAS